MPVNVTGVANWFKTLQNSQYWASTRNVISLLGGATIAIGVISASQETELVQQLLKIVDSIYAIVVAIGSIMGIVAALLAGRAASTTNQLASAKAKDPTALVDAAANTPGVKQIIASHDMATATESSNVISLEPPPVIKAP